MKFLLSVFPIFCVSYIFLWTGKAEKICRKFLCKNLNERPEEAKDESCMQEQLTDEFRYQVFVYDRQCNYEKREYCYLHQIWDETRDEDHIHSFCKENKTLIAAYERKMSYPGEACDSYNIEYLCPYGEKRCSFNRCAGRTEGDACPETRDCDPGLFCSTDNICTKFKKVAESCLGDMECGRQARCMRTSPDTSGLCTKYFSLTTGVPFYAYSQYDQFMCADKVAYNEELLTNETTNTYFQQGVHICGKTVKSANRDKQCEDFTACPTTATGVYAHCGCRYDTSGYSKCGIMNEDTEFQKYRELLIKFYEESKYCHVAREFGSDCGYVELFRELKCAEMQIKYYDVQKDAPSCVSIMSNKRMFPQLNEVENWCTPDRDRLLLQLGKKSLAINNINFSLVVVILLSAIHMI